MSFLDRALTFFGAGPKAAPTTPAAPSSRHPIIAADDREPQFRTIDSWSPDLIRSARYTAESGNLRFAGDLCEWILADDRVKATLDSRTDALLGLDLSFEFGRGRRKNRAVKALEAGEDWWTAFPETEIRALQAWGLLLGCALARLDWIPNGDRLVPRLRVHNPRHLRWDWTSREWRLTTVDGEITINPGDGQWLLYTPYGSSRPWVQGAFQSIAPWVLLKVYARQDWGYFSERSGQGTWVVTGTTGTEDQRKQIAADIAGLGRNATLALDNGFDLKLVESIARNWETFRAQIDAADLAISTAILGQNLTSQVSAGSQAAATVHGRVALARTKADAETLSTCLHDQALTHWAAINFAQPESAPWPTWDTEPAEDLKERAAMVQMVSQAVASFATAGAPVDVPALLTSFRIPVAPEPPLPPVPSPEPGSPDPTPVPETTPTATPAPAPPQAA